MIENIWHTNPRAKKKKSTNCAEEVAKAKGTVQAQGGKNAITAGPLPLKLAQPLQGNQDTLLGDTTPRRKHDTLLPTVGHKTCCSMPVLSAGLLCENNHVKKATH